MGGCSSGSLVADSVQSSVKSRNTIAWWLSTKSCSLHGIAWGGYVPWNKNSVSHGSPKRNPYHDGTFLMERVQDNAYQPQ